MVSVVRPVKLVSTRSGEVVQGIQDDSLMLVVVFGLAGRQDQLNSRLSRSSPCQGSHAIFLYSGRVTASLVQRRADLVVAKTTTEDSK
jgi:hypothetical protein